MATLDPFTTCYQAVRNSLLGWGGFAALVKPGNFPDLSSTTFERFKTEVQPADLPEAALVQGAFSLRPFGENSRVSSFSQAFPLVCTQDKLQVTPANVLKYHALVALLKAGDTLGLDGLVRNWEIVGGNDDLFGQAEWKRSTMRIMSAFTIVVHGYIDRESLAAMSYP